MAEVIKRTIDVVIFRDGRADVRFSASAFDVWRAWLFDLAMHQPDVVPGRPYVCYLRFGLPRFGWEGCPLSLSFAESRSCARFDRPLYLPMRDGVCLSCVPYAWLGVVRLCVSMILDVGHDSLGNSICYGRCSHSVPNQIVALRDLMIQCYADGLLSVS